MLFNNNYSKVYLWICYNDINSISVIELVTKSELESNNRDIDKTNLSLALLGIKSEVEKK